MTHYIVPNTEANLKQFLTAFQEKKKRVLPPQETLCKLFVPLEAFQSLEEWSVAHNGYPQLLAAKAKCSEKEKSEKDMGKLIDHFVGVAIHYFFCLHQKNNV